MSLLGGIKVVKEYIWSCRNKRLIWLPIKKRIEGSYDISFGEIHTVPVNNVIKFASINVVESYE